MLRNCIGCGQVDDHPRHVLDIGGDNVMWHHDCHSRATGCEVCEAVAAEGHTGDELRAHIEANNPGGPVAERLNEQAAIDAGQVSTSAQED